MNIFEEINLKGFVEEQIDPSLDLFDEIEKLSEFDPEVREFLDYFLNGATFIEADNAGRLLIPPNLKEQSGLEKDIVLIAKIKRIEIWDKSKYHQFFESFSPEAFSSLAKQVMNPGGPTA